MVFDERADDFESEPMRELEPSLRKQAVKMNSPADESEFGVVKSPSAGGEITLQDQKQLDMLKSLTDGTMKNRISRKGLLLIQLSTLVWAVGCGALYYESGALSNIFRTLTAGGVGSYLFFIGGGGMVTGVAMLVAAGFVESQVKQFVDDSIEEIAKSDPALAAELEDTPEDLRQLYVEDRRHRW